MKKFLFLKIALIMLLSTTASTVWATGAKEAPAASPAAEMKVNYAAEAVKNYYADQLHIQTIRSRKLTLLKK